MCEWTLAEVDEPAKIQGEEVAEKVQRAFEECLKGGLTVNTPTTDKKERSDVLNTKKDHVYPISIECFCRVGAFTATCAQVDALLPVQLLHMPTLHY